LYSCICNLFCSGKEEETTEKGSVFDNIDSVVHAATDNCEFIFVDVSVSKYSNNRGSKIFSDERLLN
jgi:hypothetical protein